MDSIASPSAASARARARAAKLLTLGLLLLTVGCGGGGDDPAPAPPPGGTPPPVGSPPPPSGGDTVAPVATLTSPSAFASGLAGTVAVSATATDNVGVAAIDIQVDGQAVGGSGSGASHAVNVDTNSYASGQHIVRARARDAAGNLSAWASATVQFGGSRAQPAGFTQSTFVGGLSDATAIAQAPDGRFFVAQQGGALRVVTSAGALLATPFISLTVDSTGERGLIGVALHPDFATNRYVYLHYTTPEGGTHNRISRFTANASNPNTVSVGSELRIADLPALSGATNHNGGALHFGSDGKLYVGVGDNTRRDDAPLLTSRLGKMLRFNDDGSIPTDNPFYNTASGDNRSIWATGLRNPYTFAVQPGTGRIHINDVGESTWEEINLATPGMAGANYGWPSTEGPTSAPGVTAPLFAYGHNPAVPAGSGVGGFFSGVTVCASIAGGAFYPDTVGAGAFPAAYRGNYYFSDYCTQAIGRLDLANGNAAYAFGSVSGNPVDMLTGSDGALYVLMRGAIARFSAP